MKSFVPVRAYYDTPTDDPTRLRIDDQDDAWRARVLQVNILTDLLEKVHEELVGLDIDGQTIIFYHGQEIKHTRHAKKMRGVYLLPAIFSFGFRTSALHGESEVWVWATTGFNLLAECSGRGIGYDVMKYVSKKFVPNPIHIKLCSRWDNMAKVACGVRSGVDTVATSRMWLPSCKESDFPDIYPRVLLPGVTDKKQEEI